MIDTKSYAMGAGALFGDISHAYKLHKGRDCVAVLAQSSGESLRITGNVPFPRCLARWSGKRDVNIRHKDDRSMSSASFYFVR